MGWYPDTNPHHIHTPRPGPPNSWTWQQNTRRPCTYLADLSYRPRDPGPLQLWNGTVASNSKRLFSIVQPRFIQMQHTVALFRKYITRVL
jgi:hypothetical protein